MVLLLLLRLQPIDRIEWTAQELEREVRAIFDDPDAWLDAPNSQLGGRPPRSLLGQPDQHQLEDLVRAMQLGFMS
jgi:hypothetical protein